MRKSTARDIVVGSGFILFAALVALHWVRPGKVLYAEDLYWLSDPWNVIHKQLLIWNSFNSVAGKPRCGLVVWFQVLLLGLLTSAFGASAGQMLSVGLLIGIGWVAMYAVLRLVGFATVPAAIGSTAYAFNPWSMVQLPLNETLRWCYATGPISAALLIAAGKHAGSRGVARLSLILVAALCAAGVATNPGELAILIALLAYGAWLGLVLARDRSAYGRWLLPTGIGMFLASLWWLVPMLFNFLIGVPVGVTDIEAARWVVARASFDNVLRFLPFWTWGTTNYLTFAGAYDGNLLTYMASFGIIAVAAASLVVRAPSRIRLAQSSFGIALLALFVSKGIHPPLAALNALLYRLPGTAVWREPTTKFPLIALFAIAICVAIVMEHALASIRRPSRRALVAAGTIGVFFLSAAPLFAGVYSDETLGLPSSYVTIPQYWYEAGRWLNEQPSQDAVLALPADSAYQVSYSWGMHAVDFLPSDVFHRHVVLLGKLDYVSSAMDNDLVTLLQRMLAEPSGDIVPVLHLLDIRYVLFRGDVWQDGSVVSTASDVARHLPNVEAQHFGPLTVFDTGEAVPEVTKSTSWIAGDYGGASIDPVFELGGILENVPRVRVQDVTRNSPITAPAVYEIKASEIGGAFPGGDEARRVVASAKVRYIWTPPTKHFLASFDRTDAIVVGVRANEDPATSPRATLTMPGALFARAGSYRARTLPSEVGLEEGDAHHTLLSIVNPSDGPLTADIDFGVLPRGPTTYVVSLDERTYVDSILGAQHVVWASFKGLTLQPGLNQLFVSELRSSTGRSPVSQNPLIAAQNSLSVGAVRVRVTVDSPDTSGDPSSSLGAVALNAAGPRRATFASIPLDGLPLVDHPFVVVDRDAMPPIPAILGATVDFSNGGSAFRCFATIGPDDTIDVEGAIVSCADVADIVPTTAFVENTTLDRVDLVAMLYPGASQAVGNVGVHSASARWTAAYDSTFLSPAEISTQGVRGSIVPDPNSDSYVVLLSRQQSFGGGLASDLTGSTVQVRVPSGQVEGTVTNDTAQVLQVATSGGARQDIRKSSIEAISVVPTNPSVTLSFDPSTVAPQDILGFAAKGLPLRSAWLGHTSPDGDFVNDVDLTTMLSQESDASNQLALRPADLMRAPGYNGRVGLRFNLSTGAESEQQLTLLARSATPVHGRITATVGPTTWTLQPGQPPVLLAASQRVSAVRIDDHSAGASVGIVGTPPLQGSPMQPADFWGAPALLAGGRVSNGLVQLRQAYSPSWAAMCFGICWPLPAHLRDQAGWNDWSVTGAGILVFTNLLVVAQWFAALLSLLAPFLAARSDWALRAATVRRRRVPAPQAQWQAGK